jgi:hypothetical protein
MDVKGIDWNDVYKTYSPQVTSGMSDRQLFDVCADMLSVLDDSHVELWAPFAFFISGNWLDPLRNDPFSLNVVKTYLTDGGKSAGNGLFLYGTFSSKPEVGYIYIAGFAFGDDVTAHQDWAKDIDVIVRSLANTSALILDIRGNTGGLASNVNYIASRFAAEKKDYAKILTKNGPGSNDFSAPVTNTINPAGSKYTKPVVLLTNKQTISAGEWFTLALLTQSHITHAGGTTNGAFSLSLARPLINGWIYRVSVQKVTDMQDICYEGTGITPDITNIKLNTVDNLLVNIDDQLDYALTRLN